MRSGPSALSLALLTLMLCALPALAGDEAAQPDLVPSLAAFLSEEDATARMAQGMRIAFRWPDAAQVAAAVGKARTWPKDAAKGDIVTWKRRTADGVEHTILANIPASYDPAKAWPVFLWLHGSVARNADGGGASGISAFEQFSDREGFLLLSPSAQRGSEWWTPNGVALVRGALADLARRYHVDGNRVAVSGFSDGASACFHLQAHDPDPYACFLPLMPHPGVTRLAGGPCFSANVRSRPMLVFNGGKDARYPATRVKPLIDELKAAGADITWEDLPYAEHNPGAVLPDRWEDLRTFWKEHPRDPLPRTITWESAVPALDGRFGWVEIVEVDEHAPSDESLKPSRLKDPAGRPLLGIQLNREHRGPGIKIELVTEDSAAAEAGFQVGDVILKVDGAALEGQQAFTVLRRALGTMTNREGVFTVKRGDEELEIQCQPRVAKNTDAKRPKALGYGLPSGRIEASVAAGNRIDVKTRHVGLLKLHLAPGLVDLTKPVTVFVNGKQRFVARPTGNVAYVLGEAVRGGPGAPAWQAAILLRP